MAIAAVAYLLRGALVSLPLGKRKLSCRWGAYARGKPLSLGEETLVGIGETVAAGPAEN